MAYQTGTALSVDDLLDKIRVFAEGLGWTTDAWSSGTNSALTLHNPDQHYFRLYAESSTDSIPATNPAPRIYCAIGTGFSGAILDPSDYTASNGLFGPFHKYHFFGTVEYVHVVIEIDPGIFAHLGIGVMQKTWAYQGGEYVYGTSWNHAWVDGSYSYYNNVSSRHCLPLESDYYYASYTDRIRVDVEGISPYYFHPVYTGSAEPDGVFYSSVPLGSQYTSLGTWWYDYSPNTLNGIAPMYPIVMGIRATGGKHYFVGSVRDMRWLRCDYITPSDTITYGTDDWMVFPVKRKALVSVPLHEPSSEKHAIAYLKV